MIDSRLRALRKRSKKRLARRRHTFESLESRQLLAAVVLPVDGLDTADVDYQSYREDIGGGLSGISDANSLGIGGNGDHFDDAFGVTVEGTGYSVAGGDLTGNILTLDTSRIGQFDVQVSLHSSGPVMRQIVTVTNIGGSPAVASVGWHNNTGNDSSQRVIGSSDGDTAGEVTDRWIVTSDSNSVGGGREVNSWMLFGPGNPLVRPTSLAMEDGLAGFGSAGEEGLSAVFDVALAAGETRSVMWFVGLEGFNQEGLDLAARFNNTNSAFFQNLIADLSPTQESQIVNWDIGATQVPRSTLAGEVWADLNADGQRNALETGIPGVRVYADQNGNNAFDTFEPFTMTDSLGRYSLQLNAGAYVMRLDLAPDRLQTSPRAYFGTGYTAVGDGSGTNPTQLFQMSETGQVLPIGQPTGNRIHGLIRTNDGIFFGVNFSNDSIYTINGTTGQETLLAAPANVELVAGLAYDPAADTIYTVGRAGAFSNVMRLYEVGRDGSVQPIGPGMTGLQNVSDLTFDTTNNRIVGFDNSDDEFFAFDLLGNGSSLSNASRSLNSWSLAYNGTSFVMLDQGDPTFRNVLQVNPDTGVVQPAFQTNTRIPTEALFFAESGVAQRVTLGGQNVSGIDFGVAGGGGGGTPGGGTNGLGGLYINELLVAPLFGNPDTDQYVEIRGDADAVIPDNTYLVIVDDDNNIASPNGAGEIHGIFDLSNQTLGSDGFLVLLEQDSPHSVAPTATVLRSTEVGFGGLPGDIYSDSYPLSERIDFVIGANTFFLVQSDVAPVLGADIDVDDDGLADLGGVIADWTVLDSISMHPFVGQANQAYGQIVMVEERSGVPDPLVIPPNAELVIGPGFGYVGRIGDSLGSTSADWVTGTVQDEAAAGAPLRYGLEAGIQGVPLPLAFQGRDLDHVGDSNFVGGVRGHVILESTDGSSPPAAGVTVFADVNGNGQQDNLLHVVDPDDFPAGTPLINNYPGVTINSVDINNEIVGFPVTAEQQFNFPITLPNRTFAKGGIDWFPESNRLRFDFYAPANAVSIVGIADESAFTPTYIRLDAYDANDTLLGSVLSNRLISSSSEVLSLSFASDVIAYAVAYADESVTDAGGNPISSSPFGRLDRFSYRQLEASGVTDANGFYEISNLFPDRYQVTFLNAPGNPPLSGAEPVPIRVTRYENFVLGPNDAPSASDLFISINENSAPGTMLGTVQGSDGNGLVTYSIVSGDSQGILINSVTGELVVGSGAVLDFETTPEIVFQVGVSDPLSATTVANITVSLNDVNERPVVTDDPFVVPEDAENGTAIGQIQATDPDTAQNQSLTFAVTGTGGSAAGIFEVNASNGIVTLIDSDALDFETQRQLDLVVTVTDDGNPELAETIVQVINLTDANDAPTITTTQLMVPENSSGTVGQLQFTDPDQGQAHQFILTGGTGAGLFDVTSDGTVRVRQGVNIDYETNSSYDLSVLLIDSGAPPLSTTASIDIAIVDINEPPAFQPSSATVAENSPGDTLVTTINAIDPEGMPENYLISMVNNQNFTFDVPSGELRVADGAVLDFETQRFQELFFRIVDTTQQTATVQTTFTVELTDANDAPRIVTERLNVSELAPRGSVVGQIRVSDPDGGDGLVTEIIGGTAANLFNLDPDSHLLTVAADANLDAESDDADGLTLEVQVTDGTLTATRTIAIVINDVNEPPVFAQPLQFPPAIVGIPYSFTIPGDAVIDPEGQSYELAVYNAQGVLPGWLTFNSQTRTLSGMPTPELVGTYPLTVHAFEVGPFPLFVDAVVDLQVFAGENPYHNQRSGLDVDDNQLISSNDALRILNFIRDHGPGIITVPLDPFYGFVDTNNDRKATSLDALLVINALVNQEFLGSGESIGMDDDRRDAIDAAIAEFGDALLF